MTLLISTSARTAGHKWNRGSKNMRREKTDINSMIQKHPKVCTRNDCPFNIPPDDPTKFGRCKILERKARGDDTYINMTAENCLWAEYPEVVQTEPKEETPKEPETEKLITFNRLLHHLNYSAE